MNFSKRENEDGKWEVIGLLDDLEKSFGLFESKGAADDEIKILQDSAIKDIKTKPEDIIPDPPPGIDKATGIKSGHDFTPDLYKAPMGKKKGHQRRILNFQDFLKRINYRTHDGDLQKGHGQNLTGGK